MAPRLRRRAVGAASPAAVIGPATVTPTTLARAPVAVTAPIAVKTSGATSATASNSAPSRTGSGSLSSRTSAQTSRVLSSSLSQARSVSSTRAHTSVQSPTPTSVASATAATLTSATHTSASATPSSTTSSANATTSSSGIDPTVTVSIVLIILGLLSILAAGVTTFYWRHRRGRQGLTGAFVAYMRNRDSGISATSSWDGGWEVWEREERRGLWGDKAPGGYSQYSSQNHGQGHGHDDHGWSSHSASHAHSPFPTATLWRPHPDPHPPDPDYIPYTGPIEPPSVFARMRESWRNRPLPPLPPEAYERRSRDTVTDADPPSNVLGLHWDAPTWPFSTPASSRASFSPAVQSSRFSFQPSPPPPLPMVLNTPETGIVERPKRVSAPSGTFSFASYLSRLSFSGISRPATPERQSLFSATSGSRTSRTSRISTPSATDATLATLTQGFAFNGHRSTAALFPASEVERARSATPALMRSDTDGSYRVLVAKSRKDAGSRAELADDAAIGIALPGPDRHRASVRSAKSAKSVRFAEPYPFAGIGSGLNRSLSQPAPQ